MTATLLPEFRTVIAFSSPSSKPSRAFPYCRTATTSPRPHGHDAVLDRALHVADGAHNVHYLLQRPTAEPPGERSLTEDGAIHLHADLELALDLARGLFEWCFLKREEVAGPVDHRAHVRDPNRRDRHSADDPPHLP